MILSWNSNYICKDPYSKWGHVPRFQVDVSFGQGQKGTTIQPMTPTHHKWGCLYIQWKIAHILILALENCSSDFCHQFSSVQSLIRVRIFATPWTAACQDSLSITNSQSLLKLMSTELVMPSNHLILCHPLLLLSSVFSSIKVFSNEIISLHQVAKVLEFQLQHQSFQWIFKTDFL